MEVFGNYQEQLQYCIGMKPTGKLFRETVRQGCRLIYYKKICFLKKFSVNNEFIAEKGYGFKFGMYI